IMTVSPVGQGRVRGRERSASSSRGTGLGRGCESVGSLGGASSAGAGNFHPSVETSKPSLPSARVHGGSVSRRASRTVIVSGRSKRGRESVSTCNVRSADQSFQSGKVGSRSSGRTVGHSHPAGLGNCFADSGERLEQVEMGIESVQSFANERQVVGKA